MLKRVVQIKGVLRPVNRRERERVMIIWTAKS